MIKKLWFGKLKWIKRIVIVCVALGILGLIAVLGINTYVISSTNGQILADGDIPNDKVDCILVLGAGVRADGKPSLVLTDRLNRAIELYEQGVSDKLLMSGDHGRDSYDEVAVMKQYAIDAGIPADNIFMDHAGFSTYESVYRARDVFEVGSMVIVTQPFHINRALYIADKLGVTASGAPCKETHYRNSWMLEVREKLARTKEFFNLMLQPEPTYLGEPIPISGSGSQTDESTEQ